MTAINAHGLKRPIPEGVKRTVRRRCGFGCVFCGQAVIQYEHFNPDFVDAKVHDPDGITLLCAKHHDKVTRGQISKAAVAAANAAPHSKRNGFAVLDDLLFMAQSRRVRLGPCEIAARNIVRYKNKVILGFGEPEGSNAPLRLSMELRDEDGTPILSVINNEVLIGIDRFDVETVGTSLLVRSAFGVIILKMSLCSDRGIRIERLNMSYEGYRIIVDGDWVSVTAPWGATVRNGGGVQGDEGWVLQEDLFDVATNGYGGGAIRAVRPAAA